MFQAKVHVTLKKSVLDPQGKTILNALHSLGFKETSDVRVGKYFEIKLKGGDRNDVDEKVREMCAKLLANPVIEEYNYSVEEGQKG